MKSCVHFLSYFAHFFLEWEISGRNLYTENQNTYCVQ